MLFKLRAAVDLDGLNPEGKLPFKVLQEAGRGQTGLSSIGPGAIPSAEKVAGAELVADIVRLEPELKSIHLHQVSRRFCQISVGHPACLFPTGDTAASGSSPPRPPASEPAGHDVAGSRRFPEWSDHKHQNGSSSDRRSEAQSRSTGRSSRRSGIGRFMRALGRSPQKPQRRAIERDEAAIQRWVKVTWLQVKKTPRG
jgi:hypothetical protein